jgi:hypothetical protein
MSHLNSHPRHSHRLAPSPNAKGSSFMSLSRPRFLSALLLCAATSLSLLPLVSGAEAQTAGRARVRGEVQGLELALDGGLSAPRGGILRFNATLYEVLGLSNLRLARNARIEVTSSLDPTAAALDLHADASGRVNIEIPVPDDAPGSFGLVLRAISAASGGVQRRFELSISTFDRRSLVVQIPRLGIAGDRVPVVGYLSDLPTSHPLAASRVRLTLRDEASRTLLPPVEVTTDASGLFSHVFTLPDDRVASASVEAALLDEDGVVELSTSASAPVVRSSVTPLLVAVSASRRVVEPGSTLPVDIIARTGEGRPIAGATCIIDGPAHDDPAREQRTDERGRARFSWHVPDYPAAWNDLSINVSCSREAIGSGYGTVSVRMARVERAASFAVESGALVPSLGGRVWVRVVTIDGRPAAAGVAVELTGPRVGTLSASTDASGVATFDITLHALATPTRRAPPRRASGDEEAYDEEAYDEELAATDNCGGEAATEISIHAAAASVVTACVPLDPDGTVRVRPVTPVIAPGGSVELELTRTSNARLPIAVSIIRTTGLGGPTAIAQRVVPAGESRVTIPLPEGVGTEPLLIRARPLFGTEGREVRGGSAMIWVAPSAWSLDTAMTPSGLRLPTRAATRAYLIGLPLEEAQAIFDRAGSGSPVFPEIGSDLSTATPALLAGALAARTTRDVGAPFVLRGAALTPVPAPADPTALGLLRDPWRAQARFVTGRLALVFSAIEQQVAAAVPERIEDVAVETGGRFTFNAQILASIADSGMLGAEGATGLGGEDLSVDALRAFDPAFTYDNVARRITRERLFRIMVALRAFVQQNGFDLPWARLGDPSTWLQHLPEIYTESGAVQPRELVDGWGRPFVLRALPRARFTGWSPLDGWEVASPGADGRIGNGDDVFDPTARVLPTGSPYAQAVGEDALVARLRGVELGRATVELLASYGATDGYVEGVPYSPEEAGATLSLSAWSELPSRMNEVFDPLALRRPDRPADFVLGEVRDLDGSVVALPFDEEPRTWGVATYGLGSDGTFATDLVTTLAGSPLIVEERLPSRVRVGEPLHFELLVTNVSSEDRTFTVSSDTEGPLSATVTQSIVVRAGTSAPVEVELSGERSGHAHLMVRFESGGSVLRTVRAELAIDAGRHPIRTRNAGLVGGGRSYGESFSIPGNATDPTARLVLLAPTGLAYDPDLAEVRESDPGLLAWSLALAGRPVDDVLRANLLRVQQYDGSFAGRESVLSTACALVALAGADEADTDAASARDRARNVIAYASPAFEDADGVVGGYRGAAAVLAALAPGGVYDPASGGEAAVDPVAAFAGGLRTSLRRALRTHPEEPTVMARTAAALLLADPGDARGLAMYERASAAVADVPGGRLVTPSAARMGTIEQLTASLALAVAAHQVGDDTLAHALVRAVLYRDNLVLSRGGEALFWWLAVGAYGVLGADPSDVRVSVDGTSATATFEGGVAVLPATRAGAGSGLSASVSSSDGMVVARLEAVYGIPFTDRTDGPFTLVLEGDPGSLRRVAALELAITATEEVGRPVLYLQLPAGVEADDALLASVGSSPYVASLERRRPGLLRMVLRPMSAGTTALVSLPVAWTARGTVRGLGAIVHPADAPERMTVIAPRAFDIE